MTQCMAVHGSALQCTAWQCMAWHTPVLREALRVRQSGKIVAYLLPSELHLGLLALLLCARGSHPVGGARGVCLLDVQQRLEPPLLHLDRTLLLTQRLEIALLR